MHIWTKYLTAISSGCIFPAALIFANNPVDETDSLLEANEAIKQHIEADNFHEALPLAERVVALVTGMTPYQPTDLVAPLHNLAIIQQRVGQVSAAQENLKRSIRIAVDAEGEYAPGLVRPLRYLGRLHYENQDYAESLAVLRRAQHITHRNHGVYSLNQLGIVNSITNNHLKTNAFVAADVQQRFYYKINEINFGADDARMIPAVTKLGNWFKLSGQLPAALKMYRKSLFLLEQQGSDSDLELIEPLRSISSTLYLQGACCPDEPLDRALDILASHPVSDAEDRVDALIHLADMSLLKKNEDRAKELYQKVWHMLASNQNGHKSKALFGTPTRLGISRKDDVVSAFRTAQKGYFRGNPEVVFLNEPLDDAAAEDGRNSPRGLIGTPLPLCFPQLLDLAKVRGEEQLVDYYVDFDFTVNQDGQVLDVAVVDSNTPPRLGRYVKNLLQRTRFRPRLSEGEPVASEHVELHQTSRTGQGVDHPSDSPIADSNAAVFQGCQILASAS